MTIKNITPDKSHSLGALMREISLKGKKDSHGRSHGAHATCYSITTFGDVAMLVEPINSAPFIFLPPCSVKEFECEPGSGTDKLRKRLSASLAFDSIITNHLNSLSKSINEFEGPVEVIKQSHVVQPNAMPSNAVKANVVQLKASQLNATQLTAQYKNDSVIDISTVRSSLQNTEARRMSR